MIEEMHEENNSKRDLLINIIFKHSILTLDYITNFLGVTTREYRLTYTTIICIDTRTAIHSIHGLLLR